MRHNIASFFLAFFFILTLISASTRGAYAHGIGADRSLPTPIGNRSVAVSASLTPDFIESTGQPQLVVRTFDTISNATIPGIDYRIAVQLRNETLFDQRFRSSDGIAMANLLPNKDIIGWKIVGMESASPDDPIQISQSSPVTLESRVFLDGGLYHIIVTLQTSSTGLAVDTDRKFDLYVTVGRTYIFNNIDTAEGNASMSARTYYDEIKEFHYESANRTILFSMPFTWEASFVLQVPVVHIELQFPKSIKELQSNSYRGTINGIDLDSRSLVIDDYSAADSRIVHFIVTNDMLTSLATKTKGNVAHFTMSPIEKPKFPMDIMSNDNKYIFEVAWGPDVIESGILTTFAMNIQNADGNLLGDSSFDFVLSQEGKEIHREHLTSSIGTYSLQYTFTKAGSVTLTASNINGRGETASAKIDLTVQQGSGNTVPPPTQQPSGCLIATAAFGSELTPQVQFLRNFRDHYILSTQSGSAFMGTFNSLYYSFSPQVANYEREQPWLQGTIRIALYPLFAILMTAERAYASVAGESGSILAGGIASSLIGAVYLWPAGLVAGKNIKTMTILVPVGATLAVLVISLIVIPGLLQITTFAFVIAVAGASAIAVAKVVRGVFKTQFANNP